MSRNKNTNKYFELGRFLQSHRKKVGIKQGELAKRLGYTPQFVANWERGVCSPPLDTLYKIAQLCEIPKNELIRAVINEREKEVIAAMKKRA